MRALDQQEQGARGATPDGPSAEEATEFLRNLPGLWDRPKPSGRKLLAEALFERIDVLGAGKAKLHPSASAKAQGGPRLGMGLDWLLWSGERSQTDRSDLNVPLVLSCELIGAGRWSRAIAG